MRIVAAPPSPLELPGPSMLGRVRNLGERFPHARLRDVPLVRASELDLRADSTGCSRVWLALEALQVTGSFKVRGALCAIASAEGPVVAASAGNHGVGVAYAGRVLNVPSTIFVPRTAPRAKRSKIEAYGAELVVVESDHYDDVEQQAKAVARERGAKFISPYDDLDVILGNGTSLGYEVVRVLGGVPECVLTPFGGGGLATGLAWAFADEAQDPVRYRSEPNGPPWALPVSLDPQRRSPSNAPKKNGTASTVPPSPPPERSAAVWGVQSEASCAMALSLDQGTAVERLTTSAQTLAEGLEGGISASAFARASAAISGIVVASESDIAAAMTYAYREIGLVLEGSAAVALAPVLRGLPDELRGGDVLVVLTGRNVDQERLESAITRT